MSARVRALTLEEALAIHEASLERFGGHEMAAGLTIRAERVPEMRRRLNGVRVENVRLRKKIEEIRLINRAKYILMEYLSMTEQQAHRYLEKQAMDLRITKIQVAENLLSTYDS